jgi:hypothetical protein
LNPPDSQTTRIRIVRSLLHCPKRRIARPNEPMGKLDVEKVESARITVAME